MEKTRLTPEILLQLGFVAFKEDSHRFGSDTVYRLKVPKGEQGYYAYDIQASLGNYPDSNPNSGIVCLYDEADRVPTFEKDKTGRWKEVFINFPERIIPVAWHVTTLERLQEIYKALTGYTLGIA